MYWFLLFVLSTNAQINEYALIIKEKCNLDYELTIKNYALKEWGKDRNSKNSK